MTDTAQTLGQLLADEANRRRSSVTQRSAALALLATVKHRLASYEHASASNFRRLTDAAAPLDDQATDDAGERLPPGVEASVRSFVGPAARDVRIHHDDRADDVARSHRASAVAIGDDVYFRHNRYRPHDLEGFALVVHEATHVAESTVAHRRGSTAGVVAEERVALANEWAAAGPGARPAGAHSLAPAPPPAPTIAPHPTHTGPTAPVGPPAPGRQRPMAAAESRPSSPGAAVVRPDLDELRASIRRDLLDQIRSDFERGG